MSFTYTLDNCVSLNDKLLKSVQKGDAGRIKDLLEQLQASSAKGKLKVLTDSKLGHTISKLSKYSDASVASLASALKKQWAALAADAKKIKDGGAAVKAETTGAAAPVKQEAAGAAAAATAAGSSEEVKTEVKPEPVAEPSAATAAASSSGAPPKVERVDSQGGSVTYRKVTKTGDSGRDFVRTKLQEAFDAGKEANELYLREMVCDTAGMAEEAESHMNELLGSNSKEYKARFRSLNFNLKDPKNPTFIRHVMTGQVHVNDLAEMDVKDMASEEMKKQRNAQHEHAKMALMDDRTFRNYSGKNTEDGILKCPKCKSMKTEYIEVQTRSADEPTTKKCTCNNCEYRWKFC